MSLSVVVFLSVGELKYVPTVRLERSHSLLSCAIHPTANSFSHPLVSNFDFISTHSRSSPVNTLTAGISNTSMVGSSAMSPSRTGLALLRSLEMAPTLDSKVRRRIGKQYSSLGEFLTRKEKPALFYADQGRPPITHRRLCDFVDTFTLPLSLESSGRKQVVCIALPNGPILAATVLAVANRFTAAPINPEVGAEQFEADVQQSGASCILTTKEDAERLGLTSSWSAERQIPVFFVEDGGGDPYGPLVTVSPREGRLLTSTTNSGRVQPNGPDDIAIILFTSGTSGTKKIVPITVHSIVAGVAFVIESWALTAEDVCLNMMPLHHM